MALANSQLVDLQVEAFWVLANAVTSGTLEQAKKLFDITEGEIVEAMIKKGLKLKNSQLVVNIIQSLDVMLQAEDMAYQHNEQLVILQKMKDCEAHMYFSTLKHHQNSDVFDHGQRLNEKFEFMTSEFEMDDSQMIEPNTETMEDDKPMQFQI